jgi:hypothetical protein
MATLFPTSLDALANPHSTTPLHAEGGHAQQHINANDAIEALQYKVGQDNSTVVTSHDYKIAQLESLVTSQVAGARSLYADVRNQSGSAIAKGMPVYVVGSVGASGRLLVTAASNLTEISSSKTLGLTTSTISNNSNGQVITFGLLEGISTVGAVDGDPVWLGSNGSKIFGYVNKPSAPNHLVYLGAVVRGGNQNTGSMMVSIQNGFELKELHDVSVQSPATGDTIRYNATTDLWEKYTLNNFVTTDNLGNTLDDYVPIGDVGQPDGVASLDSAGKIPVAQLGNLINGAPAALDTLNELAAALANDSSYATTITNALSLKAPLASPTFTGTVNLSSATVTGVISVVQQAGTPLAKRPTLNFLGGALVEDDLVNNRINVTITGGIPELIDGGNFDSVSPYDGGAPDATLFENTFDAGELVA